MDMSCFLVPGRKSARRVLTGLLLLAGLTAGANTPPTVTVSAAMRAGTTLMDVTYRVTDPDDATVKVRALAFVDGVRSFAKVIRPTAWMEWTEANIGDAIATGVDHTLTWDVRQDWNTDLGNLKFEVLCRDNRGLLEFDWITIPAAGGKPELTISKNSPTDAKVLDAFFWQYAAGDPALTLDGADLTGTPAGGVYEGVKFVKGTSPQYYAIPYLLKLMNLDPASDTEMRYADDPARAMFFEAMKWHAANRNYQGVNVVHCWGHWENDFRMPAGLAKIQQIKIGENVDYVYKSILVSAFKEDGTISNWRLNSSSILNTRVMKAPDRIVDYDAGDYFVVALTTTGNLLLDTSEIGSSQLSEMLNNTPNNLNNIKAVFAGNDNFCFALYDSGKIFGWGGNDFGQIDFPNMATNVVQMSIHKYTCSALTSDGRVVTWGKEAPPFPEQYQRQVSKCILGEYQNLACLQDGSLISWHHQTAPDQYDSYVEMPSSAPNVKLLSVDNYHSIGITNDGNIISWGYNIPYKSQATAPTFIKNAIFAETKMWSAWAIIK